MEIMQHSPKQCLDSKGIDSTKRDLKKKGRKWKEKWNCQFCNLMQKKKHKKTHLGRQDSSNGRQTDHPKLPHFLAMLQTLSFQSVFQENSWILESKQTISLPISTILLLFQQHNTPSRFHFSLVLRLAFQTARDGSTSDLRRGISFSRGHHSKWSASAHKLCTVQLLQASKSSTQGHCLHRTSKKGM